MNDLHECEFLKKADSFIEKIDDDWVLHMNHLATKQDLEENHHLELVGDITTQVRVHVMFCPYCGKRFCISGVSEAYFEVQDCSKW